MKPSLPRVRFPRAAWRRPQRGSRRLLACCLAVLLPAPAWVSAREHRPPRPVSEGLWGYINMSVPAPPDEYGYGVSLCTTASPLLEHPLRGFQIGLTTLESALIVTPPKGLEVGYVPIVTRQSP